MGHTCRWNLIKYYSSRQFPLKYPILLRGWINNCCIPLLISAKFTVLFYFHVIAWLPSLFLIYTNKNFNNVYCLCCRNGCFCITYKLRFHWKKKWHYVSWIRYPNNKKWQNNWISNQLCYPSVSIGFLILMLCSIATSSTCINEIIRKIMIREKQMFMPLSK